MLKMRTALGWTAALFFCGPLDAQTNAVSDI